MNKAVSKLGSIVVGDNQSDVAIVPQQDWTNYQVKVSTVKNVRTGDFNQAQKTLDALIEAGLDPELVVWALDQGYEDYHIEELTTKQWIMDLKNQTSQTLYSDQALISYYIGSSQLLLSEGLNQSDADKKGLVYQGCALTKIDQKSLVLDEEKKETPIIKMVAVLKDNTIKLSEQVNNDLVKINPEDK